MSKKRIKDAKQRWVQGGSKLWFSQAVHSTWSDVSPTLPVWWREQFGSKLKYLWASCMLWLLNQGDWVCYSGCFCYYPLTCWKTSLDLPCFLWCLRGFHVSFFHSFAFSSAGKIQGSKQMLASYSEVAFRVVEVFSKNLLSSVTVSAVKSQDIVLT